MIILPGKIMWKNVEMKGVKRMSMEYESSICIADNLYAFLGWVVSYSDYGKEIAVDTMLKRFKLLEKIDENMTFRSKDEYKEYSKLVKKLISEEVDMEIAIDLTEDEVRRCEELAKEYTPRFKRAKQLTVEQVAEYKARKMLNKEGDVVSDEPIQPVKLIDHESKRVACVFYSPECASRVLSANKKKIKEAADRKSFYKGYIWMYCDVEMYEKYAKNLIKN